MVTHEARTQQAFLIASLWRHVAVSEDSHSPDLLQLIEDTDGNSHRDRELFGSSKGRSSAPLPSI